MKVNGKLGFCSALLCAVLWSPSALSDQVLGLLLTWQKDPATTMTIDWHTGPGVWNPSVEYRLKGSSNQWNSLLASTKPFPFSDRRIHRAELTGLSPATAYEFRVSGDTVWNFRTMPDAFDRPIQFFTGGDMNVGETARQTVRQAMLYDLDFLLIGGDITYANGDPERIGRWYDWFDILMEEMVTDYGRVIPVIAAIGNHEVFSTHRYDEETAPMYARYWGLETGDSPFYYSLFALPEQRGYNVLDFGDYMSIVSLDTNHTTPVAGGQTEWLEQTLSSRTHVPHVFPVYHVPAYPSVRSFDGSTSVQVREYWTPLFEQYGVRVAFENHDHIYKRTHPMRAGEIAEGGVVYIGDGAMGAGTREIGRSQPQDGPAWYLASAASVNHFILVTLDGENSMFKAIDNHGNVVDEYELNASR